MLIDSVDITDDESRPVELFEFIQNTEAWRFTDGIEPVTFNQFEYQPNSIERSEIKQDDDPNRNELKITLALSDEFARRFIQSSPDFPTTLTIYRGNYPSGPYAFYWKGRLTGASGDGNKITLQCEPIFTSLERYGLRARYERGCRHALYSNQCKVNQTRYEVRDTAVTVNKELITFGGDVATFVNGYFKGGIIVAPNGASRFITEHIHTRIKTNYPMNVSPGDSLRVYPGCDHSSRTCNEKFNNILNYGGFPHIPTKNPFGGSSIV